MAVYVGKTNSCAAPELCWPQLKVNAELQGFISRAPELMSRSASAGSRSQIGVSTFPAGLELGKVRLSRVQTQRLHSRASLRSSARSASNVSRRA